jgi:hypothetical protein
VVSERPLDRGPRNRPAHRRLNGGMDVLGSHGLLSIGQHLDDGLQHPAWPARPLSSVDRRSYRTIAGPHLSQPLGQSAQACSGLPAAQSTHQLPHDLAKAASILVRFASGCVHPYGVTSNHDLKSRHRSRNTGCATQQPGRY